MKSEPSTASPTKAARGMVLYRRTGEIDAIDQYSRQLVDALRAEGADVRYLSGGLSYSEIKATGVEWILLEYNPFSYGRWGVAPGLVCAALRLRLGHSVRFAVFVHEAWVPMSDCRSTIMGGYQRAQLRALMAVADTVMAATGRLVAELGSRAIHVPVSSNINPVAESKRRAREHLELEDELVVALFGTTHPSFDRALADAAVRELAHRHGSRLVVLNLGAKAPHLRVGGGVEVRTPGVIDEHALSRHLRASDLLLLPLRDGVSTRRTTLMAGLAHGLPIVASRGEHSDRILVEHPDALTLVAVGDVESYARAAVELSDDEPRREVSGAAARLLYEQAFDWPVVAGRVEEALLRPIDAVRRRRRWRAKAEVGG